ncbi:hypothetical protein GZ77_24425 [Endozoicomonas montiporae]|uniref:Uncharacterized protein n=2 Tax=Endozoicomonas montiporae TaxID=1027273 RepID=A0A081MZP2_9GAMM|nr:phosphoenolpyruvate--protein phosphotransferase [Endozoicomonas montiporae]AMO54647.1 phosphoenolpyruvate-protein phosphotransferase [Endozoicomonas montiporae CL-33]KEQ11665.1 hypothetical protein GZ77_24425 [Endozoicomonas montiporae]
MSSKELVFTCELINGLHARPASAFVREVQAFSVEVILENQRNGRRASGNSALSLISADVAYRDVCKLTITGGDADKALARLRYFIQKELPKSDSAVASSGSSYLPPSLRALTMNVAKGHATGEGWARGTPVCLKEYRFLPNQDHAVYAGVTGERLRLVGALEQVQKNLLQAIEKAELVAEREVLGAHYTLACDPDFKRRLLDHVNNGLSVVESIEATLEHFTHALKSGDSAYLQDRVMDIRDLCDQLMYFSYGSGCLYTPDVLNQHSICLADNLTPSQLLALDHRYLNGLVLESGGKASHTVLIAQARGIPVVVGAEGARELMNTSAEVILDAGLGVLIGDPSREVARYYQQERRKQQRMNERYHPFINRQAKTLDGIRLEVGANIVGVEDAEQAFGQGAESVGLFRTEMIYMQREQAPDENEQVCTYSKLLRLAENRSVIIRTMDVGADKPVDYFELEDEDNPFLGYRAIRLYPEFLDLFRIQIRAILIAACEQPASVMIPMVSCLDEVLWVRDVIHNVQKEMTQNNEAFGTIRLGIMLEVPSACLIIDQLADYVDFFSIGSNDLAQYFLAADRDNEKVSNLYSYLHPSFLRLLKMVMNETRRYQVWTGLCGEMATDPEALPLLVGLGLDEISLPGTIIPAIKEKLSHLASSDCRKLLDQAVVCNSVQSVQSLLKTFRSDFTSRTIFDTAIVNLDYEALSKEEAVKELVDMMLLDGRLLDGSQVEEAIWAREALYSTEMDNGIAIPHLQSEHVLCHSVGILRLRESLCWLGDSEPQVNTIFLLAVPDAVAKGQHMKVFSRLARKLVKPEFIERFNRCDDPQQIIGLLREEIELSEG